MRLFEETRYDLSHYNIIKVNIYKTLNKSLAPEDFKNPGATALTPELASIDCMFRKTYKSISKEEMNIFEFVKSNVYYKARFDYQNAEVSIECSQFMLVASLSPPPFSLSRTSSFLYTLK